MYIYLSSYKISPFSLSFYCSIRKSKPGLKSSPINTRIAHLNCKKDIDDADVSTEQQKRDNKNLHAVSLFWLLVAAHV